MTRSTAALSISLNQRIQGTNLYYCYYHICACLRWQIGRKTVHFASVSYNCRSGILLCLLAERQCLSHPSPINYRFRPKRKKRNKSSVKNNYCLSYTISPKVIDFSPNHFLIHYLDPQNATFCFSGFSFTKN